MLTPEQQQETLNWGIDIDVSKDNDMATAGGSNTQMFAAAATGGGAPGGGGGGGSGGSGPAGPPAPPPTLDDLTRLMADVGNTIRVLAQQVIDITNHDRGGHTGAKDVVPCPKAWDGKGGSAKPRHFLAAFHNFTTVQGAPLNHFDVAANNWTPVPCNWIQAVLNLMEGDARTWALPYLEEIQMGAHPFGGIWQTFIDHFTQRFAPLDTAEAAREALKKTQQNKGSVAEYMALFDQYATGTGWSAVDLRQQFYDGLNDHVKDCLAETHQPTGTLDELRTAVQSIDQRWCQ
jgi:hypothetical protein